MRWPDGLAHILEFRYTSVLYKRFLYTSFYEQVFYEHGSTSYYEGLQGCPSSVGSAKALLQRKQGYSSLHRGVLTRFAVEEFFSSKSFNARKKIYLVQTSYLQEEFFFLRFAQFKESKGFSTMSYVQGQRSVGPKPRIPFFWFTSIGVQKRPVLVEVLAPTRLALRGSHVRRQYRKRNTLRSKSSTIKGLLYAR